MATHKIKKYKFIPAKQQLLCIHIVLHDKTYLNLVLRKNK